MTDKHLHVKIDSIVKAEAKAYARQAPLSLGQLIEKSLVYFMSQHPQTENQRVHKTDKESL